MTLVSSITPLPWFRHFWTDRRLRLFFRRRTMSNILLVRCGEPNKAFRNEQKSGSNLRLGVTTAGLALT
jgi:alpha-amylase/alpha-mannosidase (GH57 family)